MNGTKYFSMSEALIVLLFAGYTGFESNSIGKGVGFFVAIMAVCLLVNWMTERARPQEQANPKPDLETLRLKANSGDIRSAALLTAAKWNESHKPGETVLYTKSDLEGAMQAKTFSAAYALDDKSFIDLAGVGMVLLNKVSPSRQKPRQTSSLGWLTFILILMIAIPLTYCILWLKQNAAEQERARISSPPVTQTELNAASECAREVNKVMGKYGITQDRHDLFFIDMKCQDAKSKN